MKIIASIFITVSGELAQVVERLLSMQEAGGSMPSFSIPKGMCEANFLFCVCVPCSHDRRVDGANKKMRKLPALGIGNTSGSAASLLFFAASLLSLLRQVQKMQKVLPSVPSVP
jgi:hypothetical protein